MPEIKNTFTQGKMNKDLDERLVPNGQYRDAMNIQVSTSEGSDVGVTQNVLGNEIIASPFSGSDWHCVGSITDEKNNKLYWFATNPHKDVIVEYTKDEDPVLIFVDTKKDVLKFSNKTITGINIIDDFLFWTDGITEPKKISIQRSKQGTTDINTHTLLVVNGVSAGDITEEHITVIKKRPMLAPDVVVTQTLPGQTSNSLFEKTFSRFSYRYKYEDGEYSAFGPFTDIIFNPIYPKKLISSSPFEEIQLNQTDFFSVKEPYNAAMLNSIESIDITNFVTLDMPNDVVQIDILYKKEDSPIVYSIASVKPTDEPVDNNTSNYWYSYSGSPTPRYSGKYPITSENIYAALPENQLLRPWDNVPRKALAQEITGSRIVYGNYTQNYDLGLDPNNLPIKPELKIDYGARFIHPENPIQGFINDGGLRSLKSQRNYQLGVVFGDEYGRETPVYTSTQAAVRIPWEDQNSNFTQSFMASESLQLKAYISSHFPSWASYYKFYVKQTSGEYYNLIMDRAYIPTQTTEYEENTGHLWLSFTSSDRNKINEDDYLIVKKLLNGTNDQFGYENRFRILDIKNEAPEAIKYRYLNIAAHTNTNSLLDGTGSVNGLYVNPNHRPDTTGGDTIRIDKSAWQEIANNSGSLTSTDDKSGDDKNIYISWENSVTSEMSKRYNVADIRIDGDVVGAEEYVLKLTQTISSTDTDLASNTNTTKLNDDLIVRVERKDLKDLDEFSGRFFVKVVADGTSEQMIQTFEDALLDGFVITAAQNAVWYADTQDDNSTLNPSNTIVNSQFYNATQPGSNTVAAVTGHSGDPITNKQSDWAVLAGQTNRFFIDNMYFAAGQCSINNHAKNAGDPLAGTGSIYHYMDWDNTLDNDWQYGYAPLEITNLNYFKNLMTVTDLPLLNTGITAQTVAQYAITTIETTVNNVASSSYSSVAKATSRWKPFSKDARFGYGVWSDSIAAIVSDPSYPDMNYSTMSSFLPNSTSPNGGNSEGWLVELNPLDPDNAIEESRYESNATSTSYVNGMEGLIMSDVSHTQQHRRWRKTANLNTSNILYHQNPYGVGGDEGKYFLHLSFLGPGKDLVPDTIDLNGVTVKGYDSLANHLQGIWGGGIFTAEDGKDIPPAGFPGQGTGHGSTPHIIECEGNYTDPNNQFITGTSKPKKGVGQGYDIAYEEEHEKQWQVDFPNNTTSSQYADFVTRLSTGTVFKFSADPDDVNYTINSIAIKKLYNHTPWRRRMVYNSTNGLLEAGGDSVEEAAIAWGKALGTASEPTKANDLKAKIQDFGRADNRRLVYILEIDKDPTDVGVSPNFHPTSGAALGTGTVLDASTATGIQIISSNVRVTSGRTSTTPAIFETEPKESSGLDIYYEASNAIPCELTELNKYAFAPKGSVIQIINSDGSLYSPATDGLGDVFLDSWGPDNNSNNDPLVFTLNQGLNDNDGFNSINYAGKNIKFIKQDGSYIIGDISDFNVISGSVNEFKINSTVLPEIGLSWYNCFSFGNGVESNRIRDDFNQTQISNGARVSTTTEEPYQEEHRKYGLIFSGLYNSNSGVNNLNQFIMAEKITKDINPTYGSIQKLFSRNTDLVTFCEDRVVKILASKDAVFNADGTPQLTANINVLGQTIPFIGDYGISKNPESFASETYRAYFTDQQRGAVLRLSRDGLTPISDIGMHDWFRDNLHKAGRLIGTYDAYKRNYNITLQKRLLENIIVNADIGAGQASISSILDSSEYVTNPAFSGSDLNYTNVLLPSLANPTDPNSNTYTGIKNVDLEVQPVITNFPEITQGQFQTAVSVGQVINSPQGNQTNQTGTFAVPSSTQAHSYFGSGAIFGTNNTPGYNGSPDAMYFRKVNGVSLSNITTSSYYAPPVDSLIVSGSPNLGIDAAIFHQSAAGSLPAGIVFYKDYGSVEASLMSLLSLTTPTAGQYLDPDTSFVTAPGELDPTATWDSIVTPSVLSDFPTNNAISGYQPTSNLTIFNGEEISIELTYAVPSTGFDYGDPTGPLGFYGQGALMPVRTFKIELYDGTPGVNNKVPDSSISKFNLDPSNPTGGNNVYDTINTVPVTGANWDDASNPFIYTINQATKLKGFVDTTEIEFPHLAADFTPNYFDTVQNATVRCHFKFTDGTFDDNIVVNNLRVKITPIMHQEVYASALILEEVHIKKNYRLEDRYAPGVTAQAAIPDIPTALVPAWTEVAYDSPVDWDVTSYLGEFELSNTLNTRGLSNLRTPQTAPGQTYDTNGNVIPSGNTYEWWTGTSNNVILYPFSTPDETRDYINHQWIAGTVQPLINDKIDIDATNGQVDIFQSLDTPLEIDSWYMIDIPYNNADISVNYQSGGSATTGSQSISSLYSTNDFGLYLRGIITRPQGGVQAPANYPEGYLGMITHELSSTNPNAQEVGIRLESHYPDGTQIIGSAPDAQITRENYSSSGQPVYRAIFKVGSDSWAAEANTGRLSGLRLRAKNGQFNGIINAIWLHKINELPTGGTATDWSTHPNHDPSIVSNTSNYLHSFSKPKVYFKNGQINWNTTDTDQTYLVQGFSNTPQASNDGWEFLFTVGKAESALDTTTLTITGALQGYVANQVGDAGTNPDIFDGIYFSNIQDEGDYKIIGNFDPSATFTIEHKAPTASSFTSYATATVSAISATSTNTTATNLDNKINFKAMSGGFTGAIKNISLKNLTNVFSGGTAYAWSFTGFDTTLEDYITFSNGVILFTDAPATALPNRTQIEQEIPQFIGTGEYFRVKFDYDISGGYLRGYYFNSNGKGFRLKTLGTQNIMGVNTYDTLHQIGEDENPMQGELYNTFVIYVQSGPVNGTLDNFVMQQEYPNFYPTTVTFNEGAKGWVSFKSFIPENGVSMSKQYFTMNQGQLYKHHVEMFDTSTGLEINRNTFYNDGYVQSSLTAMLNQSPSIVKIFNTLNYEGSQSNIKEYVVDSITGLTDIKSYNLNAKKGWYVESLITDKQQGTISEFIEKEGKWFNYIKGTIGSEISTADFSFQGLGTVLNNPQVLTNPVTGSSA